MAQLSLPGYRYDAGLNKYFKLQPGEQAIVPAPIPSKKRAKKIEAARKAKGKARAVTQDHQPTSLFRNRFEQRVSPVNSANIRQCVLFSNSRQSLYRDRDSLSSIVRPSADIYDTFRSDIDSIAFSRLRSSSTISPDCLTVDETIVKLCIKGDTIRIGGSNGSIA